MSPEDKNAIIVERLTERKALAVDLAKLKRRSQSSRLLNDIARSVEMIELYGSAKRRRIKSRVWTSPIKSLVTEYATLAQADNRQQVIATWGWINSWGIWQRHNGRPYGSSLNVELIHHYRIRRERIPGSEDERRFIPVILICLLILRSLSETLALKIEGTLRVAL